MTPLSWRKLTGWSGIGFVLVFVAVEGPLADMPRFSAPSDEIRAWLASNSDQIAFGLWITLVAVGVLFLLFASGVRHLLEQHDSADRIWTRSSYAGAIAMFAIAGAKSGFWVVLTHDDVLPGLSDELVLVLYMLEVMLLTTALVVAMAVFPLGASVVILRNGAAARWLGWLGLGTATLGAIGAVWPVTGDETGALAGLAFVGWLGWLTWIVGVSIGLVRTRTAESAAG